MDEYSKKCFKYSNSATRRAYGFSNENLRAYFKYLNIANQRVATVGSSGDQALYAIFEGAEAVTVIDANVFAEKIIDLKMAAIKNLSLKEFVCYWSDREVFNPNIYREFDGLGDGTRRFLDEINQDSYNCVGDYISVHSFNAPECVYGKPKKISFAEGSEMFDNNKKYNLLKNRLKDAEIEYRLAEYKDFPKVLDGKYGSILISNIYDYYTNKREFFDTAKRLVDENLENDGTFQMYYKLTSGISAFNNDLKICAPEISNCSVYRFGQATENRPFKSQFNKAENHLFKRENVGSGYKDEVYIFEK